MISIKPGAIQGRVVEDVHAGPQLVHHARLPLSRRRCRTPADDPGRQAHGIQDLRGFTESEFLVARRLLTALGFAPVAMPGKGEHSGTSSPASAAALPTMAASLGRTPVR